MSEHTIEIPIEDSASVLIADVQKVLAGSYVDAYRIRHDDTGDFEKAKSIEDAVESVHPEQPEHVRLGYVSNLAASLADDLKSLALGSIGDSFGKITVEFPSRRTLTVEINDPAAIKMMNGNIVTVYLTDRKKPSITVMP